MNTRIIKDSFKAVKDDVLSIKERLDSNDDFLREFKIKTENEWVGLKDGLRGDIKEVKNEIRLGLEEIDKKINGLGDSVNLTEKDVKEYKKKFEKLDSSFQVKSKLVKEFNNLQRKFEDSKELSSKQISNNEKFKDLIEDKLKLTNSNIERNKKDTSDNLNEINENFSSLKLENSNRMDRIEDELEELRINMKSELEDNSEKLKTSFDNVHKSLVKDYFEIKKKLSEWDSEFNKVKAKVDDKIYAVDLRLTSSKSDNDKLKTDFEKGLKKNDAMFDKRDEEFKSLVRDVYRINEKVSVINNVYADLYARFRRVSDKIGLLDDVGKRMSKTEKKLDDIFTKIKEQRGLLSDIGKEQKKSSEDKGKIDEEKKKGFFKRRFDKIADVLAEE